MDEIHAEFFKVKLKFKMYIWKLSLILSVFYFMLTYLS